MADSSLRRSTSILLLDGDRRTSQRLALMLGEDGFQVEVSSDGASALERLGREPLPDVLITELSVPVTSGVTVARFALERRPDMRVVVLTRYPNLFDPKAFARAPVVLTKPLDYPSLLELLSDAEGSGRASLRPASSGY